MGQLSDLFGQDVVQVCEQIAAERLYYLWSARAQCRRMNLVIAFIATLALAVSGFSFYVSLKKLRLDLFDRRYKVFEETWGALSKAIHTDALYLPTDLNNVLPIARFLFPTELFEYVSEVSIKLGTLYVIAMATRSNGDVVPADRVSERGELMQWFATQATAGCKDRFQPYLDFRRW